MPKDFPTHSFAGTSNTRQTVGLPGHCETCAEVGHVAAHPDLGCANVGCDRNHEPAVTAPVGREQGRAGRWTP